MPMRKTITLSMDRDAVETIKMIKSHLGLNHDDDVFSRAITLLAEKCESEQRMRGTSEKVH